jgi:hypothetical protein
MTVGSLSARIVIVLASSLAVPLAYAAGSCDGLDPCAARTCRLDAQIAKAKDKGDTRALASLERQRSEITRCSTEGLEQKRKMALEQAQQRIDQRAAELKSAEASGDSKKIASAQRKLDSARKAYTEIEGSPL